MEGIKGSENRKISNLWYRYTRVYYIRCREVELRCFGSSVNSLKPTGSPSIKAQMVWNFPFKLGSKVVNTRSLALPRSIIAGGWKFNLKNTNTHTPAHTITIALRVQYLFVHKNTRRSPKDVFSICTRIRGESICMTCLKSVLLSQNIIA